MACRIRMAADLHGCQCTRIGCHLQSGTCRCNLQAPQRELNGLAIGGCVLYDSHDVVIDNLPQKSKRLNKDTNNGYTKGYGLDKVRLLERLACLLPFGRPLPHAAIMAWCHCI